MQVGTTKDRDLYNKPSAAVHPGALAAGILPQYNSGTNNLVSTSQRKQSSLRQRSNENSFLMARDIA